MRKKHSVVLTSEYTGSTVYSCYVSYLATNFIMALVHLLLRIGDYVGPSHLIEIVT